MEHTVILGNGISGITAARHIRKLSDKRITVVSSETEHFYSRTALMYIYMGHMKYEHTKPYEDWFWKKNKIDLLFGHVKDVNVKSNTLLLTNGQIVDYDKLILATGSVPNKFGWPGQDLEGVSGMYSYQDLEYIERYTKGIERAVIVGGGLIGIELAEMLRSRGVDVTFLVREESFWDNILPVEESTLINKHILEHHVDLRLSTELKEIISDENGKVKAVKTNKDETVPCQFVGLTAGVRPNIEFLRGSGVELDRGILVNEFLQTNDENVYAIGDCAQHKKPAPNRQAVEQVWYTGRMQGETVAHTICGSEIKYEPGIWFNSAKFFDIEYQTYGYVGNTLKENEEQFYWEDQSGRKCLKIVYDKKDRTIIGVNVFGLRMRHEILEDWIKNRQKVNNVVHDLRIANFDHEFTRKYEKEIGEKFSIDSI